MKYLVKCKECEGTNLEKYEFTLSKGTIEECTEDRFRCLNCGEGMDSSEIEFKKHINIGMVGHGEQGRKTITQAISESLNRRELLHNSIKRR